MPKVFALEYPLLPYPLLDGNQNHLWAILKPDRNDHNTSTMLHDSQASIVKPAPWKTDGRAPRLAGMTLLAIRVAVKYSLPLWLICNENGGAVTGGSSRVKGYLTRSSI